MSNNLFHNEGGVTSLNTEISSKIREYETIISNIEKLVLSISGSSDWVDVEVKTAFINQCNEYISYYRGFINALNNYVNGYLNSKSKEIAEIERAFS